MGECFLIKLVDLNGTLAMPRLQNLSTVFLKDFFIFIPRKSG